MTKFPSPQSATRAVGGGGVLYYPAQGWRVRELYLPAGARRLPYRQAYDLAYETEHLDDRERAWRRARKCRRQLGSDPDAIGRPSLRSRRGCCRPGTPGCWTGSPLPRMTWVCL